MNLKDYYSSDKPFINDKDQLIVGPNINKTLLGKQLSQCLRLAPKTSKWKTLFTAWNEKQYPDYAPKPVLNEAPMLDYSTEQIPPSDQFPAVLKDVMNLLAENQGTSIPFIANVTGSFLVNPCPVSMSTFMKMWQTDEVVNRCITQNINSIVNGIGDYHHTIPECQKIGRDAIRHLDGGITGLIEAAAGASMVNGMYCSFMDKDYTTVTDEGYMVPTLIRHMPELSIQFTADYKGSINNIYQYAYNYPYAGTQNSLSYAGLGNYQSEDTPFGVLSIDRMASLGPMDFPFRTNFISNFGLVQLDKRYVLHYANQGASYGINPYGYSWLLPIYNLWIMKQLSRELYVSAQSRVAHPMLVGYASHTAKIQVGSSTDEVVGAVEALYEAMKNHTEDSALILTGLKGQVMEIDVVHSEGDFGVFEKALLYYDKGIETGLKIPGGSYESNQSYAGITAQSSVYMRNISKYRKDLIHNLALNQYMRFILQTNYDASIQDFGSFDSEVMDIDDRLKYGKLYAQLIESGLASNLDPHMIKFISKQMGIPDYTEEQVALIVRENMYNLITGSKKKSDKDNTGRKDLSEENQHYKQQSMHSQYEEARGSK